eukprot:s5877_g1.t1
MCAHNALNDFRVWRTKVGYLLCGETVPLSRALGIWSLRKRCWYQKSEISDLGEITDMSGEKDLMCHIRHLQLIYDKRQSLGREAQNWTRQQYLDYILRAMQDPDVTGYMWESMHKSMPESQKGYVNLEQTPNDRDLGESEDEDTARIKIMIMKQTLYEIQMRAMKKYIKKKHGGLDTSESEATAKESETDDDKQLDFDLGKKIVAKSMPRPNTPPTPGAASAAGDPKRKVWRKKKDESSESEAEPASSSARPSGSASASAGQTAKVKSTNKAPAPKRETSQQATNLFKDAEAAKNVFVQWTQEFANIEWFAHPGEKFPCKNAEDVCDCQDAMFWCHKCGAGYCLQCRYDGLTCDHKIAHYSVDTDPDFLPDSIASADSCFKLKELFDKAMQAESRYFGYDRNEQASYRKDAIDDLYSRARAGDKVGGKLFMKFLNEGVEEYKEEQFMMLDVYRNALASKSSLTTGNRRTDKNVTESNMTSLTLSLVSLNLGNLNRQPIMAGALKFDKYIRETEKVLPYLVFQNGGHIITLCEASDDQGGIERHADLCLKNGCIGMVVHSHADISAPALACFLRGSHDAGSWLELLGHYQEKTKNKQSNKEFWSFHGAIFRCVFGKNTSGNMIDPSTGIRTQAPDSSEWTGKPEIQEFESLGSTKDLSNDESILVLHGQLDVDDMLVPAYKTGVTNRDVFRMGLSEVRIAVFHLSSFGWRSAYQEGCDNWLKFITAAIAAQVDFITGDGNLFAQRNFKQDAHTDYKLRILLSLQLQNFIASEISEYVPINRTSDAEGEEESANLDGHKEPPMTTTKKKKSRWRRPKKRMSLWEG